jgi:metal-responsive CopG/Arc/MetJ family transcriptional regulator
MKTAISIPDEVFKTAEKLARRLHMSRSALYAKAVEEYVREHRADRVRECLDEVYKVSDSSLDKVTEKLQAKSLPKDEW